MNRSLSLSTRCRARVSPKAGVLVSCIHPIFKSGDVNDPYNYRGITVTSVLVKLFAMVLEARMSKWAEAVGLRADGQAGFRTDHRTVDNIFLM